MQCQDPEETNRPSWPWPALPGTSTHHCPWVLHSDHATALPLSLPPVWASQPYSVRTLAAPVSFYSQLDSLEGSWTWFITWHVGCCQWTLYQCPPLPPMFSPCWIVLSMRAQPEQVILSSWLMPLMEQPFSCHSLIYGSTYYSELLTSHAKKYLHNMQQVSSNDSNWLSQSSWFMWKMEQEFYMEMQCFHSE